LPRNLFNFIPDGPIIGWGGDVRIAGADGTSAVATPVVEGSETGTRLFTATAIGGTGSVTYTFITGGNPGSIAEPVITSGIVKLAGSLDYETANSYVFKIL